MKTTEQAKELLAAIEAAMQRLPDTNTFGESNASERREMATFAERLREYIATGIVPGRGSVQSWIVGPDDDCLGDFLG